MFTKRSFILLFFAASLLFPACEKPQEPAQKPPEVDQKAALLERAQLYWDTRIRDFADCYPLETPTYRETFPLKHYIRTYPGEMMYHEADVIDAVIEGNMGVVSIAINYSYMMVAVKGGLSAVIADYWELYPDGVWYHHVAPPPEKKLPNIDVFNLPVQPPPTRDEVRANLPKDGDKPLIFNLSPKQGREPAEPDAATVSPADKPAETAPEPAPNEPEPNQP